MPRIEASITILFFQLGLIVNLCNIYLRALLLLELNIDFTLLYPKISIYVLGPCLHEGVLAVQFKVKRRQ